MSADPHYPDPRNERPPAPPVPVATHDLGFDLPPPTTVTKTRGVALVLAALAVLGAAFAIGYLPKRQARAALESGAIASEHTLFRVDVVTPRLAASTRALALPGSVHPLEETVLYARVDGYLKRWLVDIGDPVHEGQLLAEIETPETDQDLAQARAQLAQAEASVLQATANRDFAQSDLERYRSLAPAGYAARSDLEQRQATASVNAANLVVARATVTAQRASVDRLLQLKSFARVVAPFAGTITSRTVDRGALIAAGTATPLFHVAAMDPARVFIQVPQDVAPSVRVGVSTQVTIREYAGRVFQGLVARTAGALDPATRTLNTEIRIPNADGALISGMYAEVALTLPTPHQVWEIPATAVMNDANGLRVGLVGDDSRVRFVPIVVERDTGSMVQISSGLSGHERVVRIASAALSDGAQVEVAR